MLKHSHKKTKIETSILLLNATLTEGEANTQEYNNNSLLCLLKWQIMANIIHILLMFLRNVIIYIYISSLCKVAEYRKDQTSHFLDNWNRTK